MINNYWWDKYNKHNTIYKLKCIVFLYISYSSSYIQPNDSYMYVAETRACFYMYDKSFFSWHKFHSYAVT